MHGRLSILAAMFAMFAAVSPAGTAQAPDWLVWRVFYERLNVHSINVSGGVNPLLSSKLGIDVDAVGPFMDLGEAYVIEISRLLAAEQSEVRRRSLAALPPTGMALPSSGINEVLERDGSIARFEERKTSALSYHKRQLLGLINAESIRKLEQWLDADVRNHIRVISRVSSPAALQQGTAPNVPTERK